MVSAHGTLEQCCSLSRTAVCLGGLFITCVAVGSGFVEKVALSRQLPAQLVDEQLAQGRIWSGETAVSAQLVDELGGECKQ